MSTLITTAMKRKCMKERCNALNASIVSPDQITGLLLLPRSDGRRVLAVSHIIELF